VIGIPSVKTMALVERRRGLAPHASFFIMEAFEAERELDRFLLKGFRDLKTKRLFVKTFAQWLASLHQRGVYHRDMKACNLLVSEMEDSWEFRLLDLEDVLLDKTVNEKKLFKSFLQLNTSIPRVITPADRYHFFKEYFRRRPVRLKGKSFLHRLIRESSRRGTVYVSPQGVVIEGGQGNPAEKHPIAREV